LKSEDIQINGCVTEKKVLGCFRIGVTARVVSNNKKIRERKTITILMASLTATYDELEDTTFKT
jgi:hypothetical protein